MINRIFALAVLGMTVTSGHATSDDPAGFDRADRLSRAVIQQIRCAQHVSRLRQSGVFGPLDSLGRKGQCAVVGDRYVGIFFDSDTLFDRVSRFSAVDLGSSTRRSEPLDTAAVLAVARASRTAQLRGRDAYERSQRPYAPLAFRFDGDSVQVWLIPASVFASPRTLGGERGYEFSPDGRTLVREIDRFDVVETLSIPDTGVVRILSRERTVPLISELIAANLLHEKGRRISIETEQESVILGEGETAPWVHVARKH